jgi:hypothetical protein
MQRLQSNANRVQVAKRHDRRINLFRFWGSGRNIRQDICVVDVDPEELMEELRARFGNDNFKIHVRSPSCTSLLCCRLIVIRADDS